MYCISVDSVLWAWFLFTALSVIYIIYDLMTNTPEMQVMKWGWALVTLYAGPVALLVYWFTCREPAPNTHEKFVAPLWKQAVGSTIHCLAGDATGIITAAAITSLLRLPMGVDAALEYTAGFTFGLFIFQSLFMRDMLGGSYWQAVKASWLPEWLSMNAVMAGMIPTMIILMTRDMKAMEPTSGRFWGIMSLASLVGAILAYPINWWLVKNKLKHGMGTERAVGKGGSREESRPAPGEAKPPHAMDAMPDMGAGGSGTIAQAKGSTHSASPNAPSAPGAETMGGMKMEAGGQTVSAARKIAVSLLTLAMMGIGIALAARYGNLAMRAGDMREMPAQSQSEKKTPEQTPPRNAPEKQGDMGGMKM